MTDAVELARQMREFVGDLCRCDMLPGLEKLTQDALEDESLRFPSRCLACRARELCDGLEALARERDEWKAAAFDGADEACRREINDLQAQRDACARLGEEYLDQRDEARELVREVVDALYDEYECRICHHDDDCSVVRAEAAIERWEREG
ncbi:MAG: hypothetical protein ACOC9T_00195 [Myxococcota bacterium]